MTDQKRRLAAILSADVVGYSRLMGDDEEATIEVLADYRDVFRERVENHDGRVVDTAGDSVLSVFDSVVEAVRCAVEIQIKLSERNAELSEDRRMRFRIGINLGDIVEKQDGTVYGEGVNVAARMEGLADPGGLILSEDAYRQVRSKLQVKFEDMGDQEVKNIAEPVRAFRMIDARTRAPPVSQASLPLPGKPSIAVLRGVGAFALLAVVGTGWILFGGELGVPTSIEQSIAVLPFDDLSPEGDQRYFVEGLSEEIINALSQIRDLKVAARTSTFILAEQNADIAAIASTLGVANVMEGSVRKEGDQIRVMATLIEAQSGFRLWSETYNRRLTGIFAIQDEIARAIMDQLQVTLSGSDQTQLVAEATESTESHEAYLRGRYLWNQRTEQSLRNAITELQRATQLDSLFAEAWSGLADSYLLVDTYTQTPEDVDFRTNLEQGVNAARRAVLLAPDLSMAHTSLAYGLWNIGQWEGAEREFERAIELNPGYANARHWYGYFLYSTGRAIEGVAHLERALELDPVSPVISVNVGRALWVVGRTEAAIEQIRETVELAPGWLPGLFELARMLLEIGEYDEGLEAWVNSARSANADVQPWRDAYQAAIRYRETGEAQTFSDVPLRALPLIWLYAHSGQPDRAIELFEDAVRQGAYGWSAATHARSSSDLVRDDPRYQALLEQAGITW